MRCILKYIAYTLGNFTYLTQTRLLPLLRRRYFIGVEPFSLLEKNDVAILITYELMR